MPDDSTLKMGRTMTDMTNTNNGALLRLLFGFIQPCATWAGRCKRIQRPSLVLAPFMDINGLDLRLLYHN